MACLDAGHYHPTEVVSAKISAVLAFIDRILLHVSRPVRWDSDHVVALDDELQRIMDEIIWNGFTDRVAIGLDFFDASINRVACWAIGMRNARKALLSAFLALPADPDSRGGGRLHPPPGPAGRAQDPAPGRRMELLLPEAGGSAGRGLAAPNRGL